MLNQKDIATIEEVTKRVTVQVVGTALEDIVLPRLTASKIALGEAKTLNALHVYRPTRLAP